MKITLCAFLNLTEIGFGYQSIMSTLIKELPQPPAYTYTIPALSSGVVPASRRLTGNTSAARTLKHLPPLENTISTQDLTPKTKKSKTINECLLERLTQPSWTLLSTLTEPYLSPIRGHWLHSGPQHGYLKLEMTS